MPGSSHLTLLPPSFLWKTNKYDKVLAKIIYLKATREKQTPQPPPSTTTIVSALTSRPACILRKDAPLCQLRKKEEEEKALAHLFLIKKSQ